MAVGPILCAFLDGCDGGQMKTAVLALHQMLHQGGVTNITDDDLGFGRQVVPIAGREIVDDSDLVAPRHQRVGEVRTDEAAASCNQPVRHGSAAQNLADSLDEFVDLDRFRQVGVGARSLNLL